jgi:lipoprotein-releasing system permease protein
MRYELFISLRYLKAKRKQIFISLITILSMAGVGLGVMALIVVLSVMSGFEEDLKTKILGTNAHLVVFQHGSPMRDYGEVSRKMEGINGVVATTPLIFTQAMLTSETNVLGIVLRGIDPNTAGRVINIENTLKKGSMDFGWKRAGPDSGGDGGRHGGGRFPAGCLGPAGDGSPDEKISDQRYF